MSYLLANADVSAGVIEHFLSSDPQLDYKTFFTHGDGLSYLGFGVQPPTPTWGNMLRNAQDEMLRGHMWMAIFPGLMIFVTVLAINYMGDGLRDALDPTHVE